MSTDAPAVLDMKYRTAPLCYSRNPASDELRHARSSGLMAGLLLLVGAAGCTVGLLAAGAASHSQPSAAFVFASPSAPVKAACEAPPTIAVESDVSAGKADLIGDAITIQRR